MGSGKPRKYPDKPQNNYPKVCSRYETYKNAPPYCHGGSSDDARICGGNPHNCIKTQYHRAASRSDAQINNEVYKLR